jgi:glycosyltransferase involved in cell wall biosynthesis
MNRSAHPFSERRRREGRTDPVISGREPAPLNLVAHPPLTHHAIAGRPRITVIVSTWNDAPFIEDCIESLLVQSTLPDEIIAFDHGSNDDTVERLHQYGPRLTVIAGPAREGSGNAVGWEEAFRRSTGNLIFLLNGHDRFKREKIAAYTAVFSANVDAVLLQAPMEKIDEHGRLVGHNVEARKHVVEHLKEIYRKQDVDLYYPASALAFSRTFLEAALPLHIPDDLPVGLATRLSLIAPHFGRVITLPSKLSEWRRPSRRQGSHAQFSRRFHFRQTLLRARIFNDFSHRHGLPPISPWRNMRFYLQLLRCSMPEMAYQLFSGSIRRRLTRATSSVR